MLFDLHATSFEFVFEFFDLVPSILKGSVKTDNISGLPLHLFLLICQLSLQIFYIRILIDTIVFQSLNLHRGIIQVCRGFIQVTGALSQLLSQITMLIFQHPYMWLTRRQLMIQFISSCCQLGFILTQTWTLLLEIFVCIHEATNLHALLFDGSIGIVEVVVKLIMRIFEFRVIAV